MTREWLVKRFADAGVDPGRGGGSAPAPVRGDHDLTPGIGAPRRLVPAAVLILLIDHAEAMTVLFTQRTDHLDNHAGQISFPGGRFEPGDGTPENTALRETAEEVGIDPGGVEVLGRLDNYITRTGFDVTPVVGLISPPLDIDPDPFEVAEVFEVPLQFFLDPANHKRDSRVVAGRKRHFHAMPFGQYYIWGATAGMLFNLYQFLVRP